MRLQRAGFLLLLVLVLPLGAGAVSWGDDFDIAALQLDVRETIDRVRPAVVQINGRGSSFSGVIVSPDGHVLSAGHAVEPGARYRISLPDGRRLRGVGKGSNPRADAALIMISDPPADLPHVPMGDSTSLVANQPCIGLSYPGGQLADQEPVVRRQAGPLMPTCRKPPARGSVASPFCTASVRRSIIMSTCTPA